MDLREGIFGAASALGLSPEDLATIISYETAGTFDPLKRGPTTKWGQHRGLIQFGEPQAQQYGVDWNDPLASQLGPDGAIVKYYQGSGWQPGMSFMDAYSVVNAGAPGRYNASDAAAGGAPGTVADKVNNQMDAHRAKARTLLGLGAGPAQPGMGAPNWTAAVNAQPDPTSIVAPSQPGTGTPNWTAANKAEPAAPFGLAPPAETAPSAPEEDYLAGIEDGGARAPSAPSGGGGMGRAAGGPTIDQVIAAIRKQRTTAAPMPFGLFPGA